MGNLNWNRFHLSNGMQWLKSGHRKSKSQGSRRSWLVWVCRRGNLHAPGAHRGVELFTFRVCQLLVLSPFKIHVTMWSLRHPGFGNFQCAHCLFTWQWLRDYTPFRLGLGQQFSSSILFLSNAFFFPPFSFYYYIYYNLKPIFPKIFLR